MIYGELSMLITFLCYHESKQGDRDILKKSQSVTRGVDILESRGIISNIPIPGYSQDSRCFGQFQLVDGAPERKN